MGLKAIVDGVDDLPEAVREHYVKRDDGKYVLVPEGVDELVAPNLKSALGKEREEARKLRERLQSFPKDVTPEKLAEALGALEELEEARKKLEDKNSQDPDALKVQMQQKHEKETAALKTEISGLTQVIETLLVDNEGYAALKDAGCESPRLLLRELKDHVKVQKDAAGNRVARVVDKDGKVRIGNANGDEMTIRELVEEMKASDEFAAFFAGTGKRGTGTENDVTNKSDRTGKPKSRKELKTPAEKSAFIGKYGLEAFKALPD